MNQNQIKWLATGLMLAEHIGLVLNLEILRIIGRLSFPLFVWVFAQNWKRDNDKNKLSKRLLLFGILSQIPYAILTNQVNLNVMFSFFWITKTFLYLRKSENKLLVLAVGMIGGEILKIDYGWYGIASSLLMLEFKVSQHWILGWSLINVAYTVYSGSLAQMAALFAPLILIFYKPGNDEKPSELGKKFFYYGYPIHMAGLAIIRGLM